MSHRPHSSKVPDERTPEHGPPPAVLREIVKCPDCAGTLQFTTVEQLATHLAAHGLASVGVVILHSVPLCESATRRRDHALTDAVDMVAGIRQTEADTKVE